MRLEDAMQRWTSAVVLIDSIPVYVRDVKASAESKNKFTLTVNIANGSDTWDMDEYTVSDDQVVEEVPELGNIQVNDVAHFLHRRVIRQFQRGLVPSQISSAPVSCSVIGEEGLPVQCASKLSSIMQPKIIYDIYNRVYPPFMDAVRSMNSGAYLSRAVSRYISLAAGASQWPVVMYKTMPVGLVRGDEVQLAPSAGSLRELVQQVSPFFVSVR